MRKIFLYELKKIQINLRSLTERKRSRDILIPREKASIPKKYQNTDYQRRTNVTIQSLAVDNVNFCYILCT